MTLIAAFELYGTPILVGDLLVTNRDDPRPHVRIPTRQDLDSVLPREEGYQAIVGLQRKLVAVSDWLVIGCAGDYIAARIVAKLLRENFKSKRVHRDRIFQFLREFEDIGTITCALVGWIADKEGCVSFSWNSSSKVVEAGGNFVDGSGRDHFRRHIESRLMIESSVPEGDRERAILESINIVSGVIGEEIAFEEVTGSLYGGGMEIMYFDGHKFNVVNDIGFMFYASSMQEDGEFRLYHQPLLILKTMYKQHALVACEYRVEKTEDNPFAINCTTIYVVGAIYNDGPQIDISLIKPSLSSSYYCVYIIHPFNGNKYAAISIAVKHDENHGLVRIIPTENKGAINEMVAFSRDFIVGIRDQIQRVRNRIDH